jgi:Tol biopolymer transport system component
MRKPWLLLLTSAAAIFVTAVRPTAPTAQNEQEQIRHNGVIAYSRLGDIYLLAASGERTRPLARTNRAETTPAWSPEGHWLAFARDSRPGPLDCKGCGRDLFIIRSNGGGLKRLSRNPEQVYYDSPTWSPNGQKLAFVRGTPFRTDIFVMNRNGRGAHRLTPHARDPDWSPSGNQIVFASQFESRGLFLIRSSGGAVTKLSDRVYAGKPAWAPDGKRIAFIARGGIYVLEVRTHDDHRITARSCGGLDWSPDATLIVVTGCSAGRRGLLGLFRMRPSGTGWQKLAGGVAESPSWQPLGSP